MNNMSQSAKRRQATRSVRYIRTLLLLGLLFAAAMPAYLYLAVNYSGKLTLAQGIPAAEAVRGFNFGPVYLEQGEVGRYFLTAELPVVEDDAWLTSFEVLDEHLQPAYRQDEIRFIGDSQFKPGERDRTAKAFTMDKATGYYYFRFTAKNGTYKANQNDRPVVEFMVRQRVIHGLVLWLPAVGSLLIGLGLLALAVSQIARLGSRSHRREPFSRDHGYTPGPGDDAGHQGKPLTSLRL